MNGGSYSLDYAYNTVGQQTGLILSDGQYLWRPPANGTAASSTPNPLNQLPDFAGNALTYDANGNLTNDGTSTLTYDVENRLTGVASATRTATFTYDPSGRRSSRTLDGVETRFLWSGDQEIAEYDGAGVMIRRFVPGPGLGRPVAMVEIDDSRFFYHYDALGSVIALSDTDGLIVARYAYSAWGETTDPAGLIANANPFRFAGYRYEAAIGLYHLRARDYSPAMGRFLQADPVGYGDGMNLYAYVGNDPLNFFDPLGFSRNSRVQQGFANSTYAPLSTAVVCQLRCHGIDATGARYATEAELGPLFFAATVIDLAIGSRGFASALRVTSTTLRTTSKGRIVSGGDNLVYQSVDAATGRVNYVGITNNIERRAAEQFRQKGISIEPIRGLGNLTRSQTKSAEQVLIETHGLSKNGGTLINKINSVAPKNPIYKDAIRTGKELLGEAGYVGF